MSVETGFDEAAISDIRNRIESYMSSLRRAGASATMEDSIPVVIDQWAAERLSAGEFITEEQRERLATVVMTRVRGVTGRLEQYLMDADIENIDVNGYDQVWVTRSNQYPELDEPFCNSDAELVEMISNLGTEGATGRRFNDAKPTLDLTLPDGSRLAATMKVTEVPILSIRRHRLIDVVLADLVGLGMITPEVKRFLGAAVRAGLNVVVGGPIGGGKTTLIRALLAEVYKKVRIGVIENAREIFAEKHRDPTTGELRHPNCVSFESVEADLEDRGGIPVAPIVVRTRRHNFVRVVLGEILGGEVMEMMQVMSQGIAGSMCTIHADDAEGIVKRIQQEALTSQSRPSEAAVNAMIESSIDLLVFISMDPVWPGGQVPKFNFGHGALADEDAGVVPMIQRKVASILEVGKSPSSGVGLGELFRPDPETGLAMPANPPSDRLHHKLYSRAGFREDMWLY